ncbi:MAG TPA: hypothetical protein VNL36_03660 [Bacteroidota bacterium]|nr:hypothetical protein [Bacteroidota bacterium]
MTEEQLSPFWSFAVKYGMAIVVLLFYIMAVMHFEYTPDDTYIYLQYAKNIANGDGFSFNAGIPSYGVTGPLWALLIAAGAAVHLDPYVVAKTFDLFFACIAILVLYLVAFLILRDKRYALLAAMLFAFDSWFLRWTGSGMESSFAVLLVLLCTFYVYRNEYALASLVCGVLSLVRPEGALLFVILQVDNFINSTNRRASLRSMLVSTGLFAAVILPWVVFSYLHFGTIVPNTVAAKSSVGMSWSEYSFVAISIAKILGSTQVLCILALVAGVWVVWRKDGWKGIRLDLFAFLWIFFLTAGYVVMKVQVVSRYLLLVSPFIVVYGVWGIQKIGEAWKLADRTALRSIVVLVIMSIGINQYLYHTTVVPHMNGFVEGMNNCLKPIAYWLREHTPENTVVLTPDVGLVGYISGRMMYDTAGLVSPAVKRSFAGVTYDEGMKERRYERVIRPDFVLDRGIQPERLASKTFQPVMSDIFPSLGITQTKPVYYTLYRIVE